MNEAVSKSDPASLPDRSYLPFGAWLALAFVRISTGVGLFGVIAVVVRSGPVHAVLDSAPILMLLAFPLWGLGFHLVSVALPAELVMRVLGRDHVPDQELSPRASHAVGFAAVAIIVIFMLGTMRRVHEAPETAKVSVADGWMVPAPYADHWIGGGREMTLAEAHSLGVQPVKGDFDWTYTSRGYPWLFGGGESAWTIEWEPEEPGE